MKATAKEEKRALSKVAVMAFPVLAALAACTEGPKYTEATAAQTAVAANRGRIAVYRSQQIQGFGVKPAVLVNGLPTGKCEVDSVFYVDVPPGRHTVSASTTETTVATVNVNPGQTSYVLCTIEIGPLVGIPKLVETARPALNEYVFTGAY